VIPPKENNLKPSRRSYHWLFVWVIINAVLLYGIIKRGFNIDVATMIILSTLVFGYMFFIDISGRIWWTSDQIWFRGWDYLRIRPMRHTLRVNDIEQVTSAYHPGNYTRGKPFDRFELCSPSDTIMIQLSFYQREEVEDLLNLIKTRCPAALIDPLVNNFLSGEYSEWWKYR